jgi:nitrate/TMAO reductase-like tetraheme cytochrome c subunit
VRAALRTIDIRGDRKNDPLALAPRFVALQDAAVAVPHAGPWVGYFALGSAAIAAAILLYFLIKRPPLDLRMKLILFAGLGVFPAIAAGTSTVFGMEQTTKREFCGSCHVMGEHFENATNPEQQTLAARHSRNPFFGGESCYVCHADYGMYGYALTKLGGMRHVYLYYFGGYREMTPDESRRDIHLMKPYNNQNCRQCHTTTAKGWRRVPDHESLKAQLDANKVSCASGGCHGFAHPFSKGADGLGHVAPVPSEKPLPSGAP